MKVLITGSSGHLGEALMRLLPQQGFAPIGLDRQPGPCTDCVGEITDVGLLAEIMAGVGAVIHSATLHKPHVVTHSKQDFIDTNVTGTLRLLEAAVAANVKRFVYTSTTSAFGETLRPRAGAPAVWLDGDTHGASKNIYGATKIAAEETAHVVHRTEGLPVIVLRTSRFFLEPDDNPAMRADYADENLKANEFLFRRVDVEDAAMAHVAALRAEASLGFGHYVVSATTPFYASDCRMLRKNAVQVAEKRVPRLARIYADAGFRMFPSIDRVYANHRAKDDLGWAPLYNIDRVLDQVERGEPVGSPLSREIGVKGYHGTAHRDGLYPV